MYYLGAAAKLICWCSRLNIKLEVVCALLLEALIYAWCFQGLYLVPALGVEHCLVCVDKDIYIYLRTEILTFRLYATA